MMDILFVWLKPLIKWPSRQVLLDSTPMCFRKHFGRKVIIIIDCFELFIDRPKNLLARTQTYSVYKHHNTVKFLIGISPQGVVSSCTMHGVEEPVTNLSLSILDFSRIFSLEMSSLLTEVLTSMTVLAYTTQK